MNRGGSLALRSPANRGLPSADVVAAIAFAAPAADRIQQVPVRQRGIVVLMSDSAQALSSSASSWKIGNDDAVTGGIENDCREVTPSVGSSSHKASRGEPGAGAVGSKRLRTVVDNPRGASDLDLDDGAYDAKHSENASGEEDIDTDGQSSAGHRVATATASSASSSQTEVAAVAAAAAVVAATAPPRIRSDGKKHVEKGSLKLEDLVQAKQKAAAKTQEDEGDEEARRDQKRAANRLSAFQSRQRRKIIIDDLQKTVAQLSKDHALQGTQISQLRIQLEASLKENEFLRAQLVATRGLLHQKQVAAAAAAAIAPPMAATPPSPPSMNGSTTASGTSAQDSFPAALPLVPPLEIPPVALALPNDLVASALSQQGGAGLNPEVMGLLQELAAIQHQMLQQQQYQHFPQQLQALAPPEAAPGVGPPASSPH